MTTPQGFLPSRDAFAFTNAWPVEPCVVLPTPFGQINIGNAASGLCGGMVFAALDYWYAGVAAPTARPADGQPLFHFLVQRLVDSWHAPVGVSQYYLCMNLPDGNTGFEVAGLQLVRDLGLAWRTIKEQWPQIAADLDRGTPTALGLVTTASANPADLGLNHQVLAYRYESSPSQVTVHVYDPNSGQDDAVHIQFDPRTPAKPTTFAHNINIAHPVRGFFRTPYSPATPPGRPATS
ncbi:MAG TPA: hypothetical protein VGS19_02465 [Streptosporangiaceae bacterium]|nr:hypothetical protein [Streptosporangiaceae bacterium]